jgi:enterochelin esterase-like enzyme
MPVEHTLAATLLGVSRELVQWVEARWKVPRSRRRRSVFGFSNGGALAIQQGLRHPDVFAHVIALSPAWQVPDSLPVNRGVADRATFFISGGLLEPALHRTAVQWHSRLVANAFSATLSEPVAGHDPNSWSAQLPMALAAAVRP